MSTGAAGGIPIPPISFTDQQQVSIGGLTSPFTNIFSPFSDDKSTIDIIDAAMIGLSAIAIYLIAKEVL